MDKYLRIIELVLTTIPSYSDADAYAWLELSLHHLKSSHGWLRLQDIRFLISKLALSLFAAIASLHTCCLTRTSGGEAQVSTVLSVQPSFTVVS